MLERFKLICWISTIGNLKKSVKNVWYHANTAKGNLRRTKTDWHMSANFTNHTRKDIYALRPIANNHSQRNICSEVIVYAIMLDSG